MTYLRACLNCGTPSDAADPTPSHCPHCPPWRCADCGQLCATADTCGCWIAVDSIPLADLKALLADDCDGSGLNVEVGR